MRYQIYEAKSVKHDAQQRVGINSFHPQVLWKRNLRVFLFSADYTRVKRVFGPEQVEAAVEADR